MFPFSGSMTMFFTAGSSPPFEDISDAMRKGDWVGLMGLGSIFVLQSLVDKEWRWQRKCQRGVSAPGLTWLHSSSKVDAVFKSNSGSSLQYLTHYTDGERVKINLLGINLQNLQICKVLIYSGQARIVNGKEIYCSFASLVGCFRQNTNGFPKIT